MAIHTFYRSFPSEKTLLAFDLDSIEIRTATSEDGQIWFAAKDVCAVLDISWSGQTLQKMPKNWVSMMESITVKGEKETTFINEPGVYRLAFRSNKPEAERFCNWVCAEVLPAIRKHGYFGQMSPDAEVKVTRETRGVVQRLVETKDAFERSFLLERARRLFRLLGQPIPDMSLIGQDAHQMRLPGV